MRSQTNAVWNTLKPFELQVEVCYLRWRSLQQVLVHEALKARQHWARGYRAQAPGPVLDAVVQLWEGTDTSSQLAAALLPLPACLGAGPLRAALATMSPNLMHIKSHQHLLCEQSLSIAAVHPRQLEKISPLATTAGPEEEEVCLPSSPLGGLPHAPLPSLIWQRGKCGNSSPPLPGSVFSHCPSALRAPAAAVSPPGRQMHA